MPDFTGGAIHALSTKPHSTGRPEFDERIAALVADWGCDHSNEFIQELIVTALKIGRDRLSVADLKLFNRSLKEMRYAARVFAPYTQHKKVVVFGSARTQPTEPAFIAAEEFGRKMQEHGFMIITGGGDGIMGAAQRGAGRKHSFGLNIRLPFEQRPNAIIDGDPKLINFNYFFTRKLSFVKETHAVALFPGGLGTLDEGFEVLTLMQTGKGRILPLVLIDRPGGTHWKTWMSFLSDHLFKAGLVSAEDFNFFKLTDNVDEAVAEILHFYKNFRSYRWVGKRMVLRLLHPLTEAAVTKLSTRFSELLQGTAIIQSAALPEEQNEPELAHLPRLVLLPRQNAFGHLRRLIDAVNDAELA